MSGSGIKTAARMKRERARLPGLHLSGAPAFTRVDLVCLIVVVTLLLGLAAYHFTGERGRVFRCAHNLKKLGQAMTEYAGEHDGKLPPAFFEPTATTWDLALMPYLRPDLFKPNSAYADRLLREAVASRFHCPSDELTRMHPRTYAMSAYDMHPDNWPPGLGNPAGVGLVWNDLQAEKVMDKPLWERAKANPKELPGVKLATLPFPAKTVLLTELVAADNQIGTFSCVTVGSERSQRERFQGDRARFHYGGFNFLMADGSVALKSADASPDGRSKGLPEPFDFDESD